MKTYAIIEDGQFYIPVRAVNKRGFYEEEIPNSEKQVICIEEEIRKYDLYNCCENYLGLDEEVFAFKTWHENWLNNNINDFSLPIKVEDNLKYKEVLREKLENYINELRRPAFIYENRLLKEVENVCDLILQALNELIEGDIKTADMKVKKILKLFEGEPFLISELDKAYPFRGLAPFNEFQNEQYGKEYSEMLREELTFYRVRTKKKQDGDNISEVNDMLHLPYNMRDKASSMRFSSENLPGLYLGVTTYMCSQECKWDKEKEDLYTSVFIPNSKGKKYKILNLTISEALINGIYNRGAGYNKRKQQLQISMLKIFPLIIATSFSIETDEKIKYQYLLSQSLMRVANECGIDGIAYLSMKGEDEFQYPQGVNLAIPVIDISEDKQYSEKCDGFEISRPIKYQGQGEKNAKSYINKIYKEYNRFGYKVFNSKLKVDGETQFYGDTEYGIFDNYLVLNIKGQ